MSILNIIMGGGQTLTSETFSASTTWVCPAGVTMLVTASGKGADGVSDYANMFSVSCYAWPQLGTPADPPTDWSVLRSAIDSYHALWTAAIGGDATHPYQTYYLLYQNDSAGGPYTFSLLLTGITSVDSIYYVNGYAVPDSGTITSSFLGGLIKGFRFDVNFMEPGSAGAASTGFGKTFAGGTYSGGTGYPAGVTNYSSVSVTPGNSYPVVIATGGYITISYLA